MKRRQFIQSSALSVVAVSSFGFIQFDGKKFIGDCETTTDILGPFYRPNSPVRSNLTIPGKTGSPIQLKGLVLNQDCATPYKNAKVELWHCDADGVYDNSTPAYDYRATGFTNEKGEYDFETILPVPYDAGGGMIRPAHFHLMITADGYQTLVTQLYFSGDENIKKDAWASADVAKNRILDVSMGANGGNTVVFNVGLAKKLSMENASMDKLIGTYGPEDGDGSEVELFQSAGKLWIKNEVFGDSYDYLGENTFEYPGLHDGSYMRIHFEPESAHGKMTIHTFQPGSEIQTKTFIKKS